MAISRPLGPWGTGWRVQIDPDGWGGPYGGLRVIGASKSAKFETSAKFLRERDVYPGINLLYHGRGENLEFDFELKPGANPRQISLEWNGRGALRLAPDGSLALDAMRLNPPFAYQLIKAHRTRITCRYVVSGSSIRFVLGQHDRSRELVVDPEIVFSQISDRGIEALTTDPAGNLYTAWFTNVAPAGPTPGAYAAPQGNDFLSKQDVYGRLLWTARLKFGYVPPQGLAVDLNGNVYVAGSTPAFEFPQTSNAFTYNSTSLPSNVEYGFVSELSADGSKLLYSTLLTTPLAASDGAAAVSAIALSASGQLTIAGTAYKLESNNGMTIAGFNGNFVARLSQDHTHFEYSSSFSGTVTSLALDANGNAVVGGWASAADPGVPGIQKTTADVTFYASKDGGATVSAVSDAQQYATTDVTFNPAHPDSMLRSTYAGVFQSEDGGVTWTPVTALGSDHFYSVWIDSVNPDVRLACSAKTLFRSEDGGNTWNALSGASTPLQVITFRADGANIIAANLFALSISLDNGKTWTGLSLLDLATPVCCAIDPANWEHFLVGSYGSDGDAGIIIVTNDGGDTFRDLPRTSSVPLAFDPAIPNLVYGYEAVPLSGAAGLLYSFKKSDDGGITWRLPASGAKIPINRIAVDPSGSGALYAFGPEGVYRSADRGENWRHIQGELANGNFNGGAVVFGSPDRIYAFGSPLGDGYLARLDGSGKILFSTLVGGRNSDFVQSVAVLSNGDIVAAGTTDSDDLLVSGGAPRRTTGGPQQGFLAKLSPDGSSLLSFRYVGGNGADAISSIALLSSGEIAAVGSSSSIDEPDITADAIEPRLLGTSDATIAVFSADTLMTRYFSYLGGDGTSAASLAVSGMRAFVLGGGQRLAGSRSACGLQCESFVEAVDLSPGSHQSRPHPRRER